MRKQKGLAYRQRGHLMLDGDAAPLAAVPAVGRIRPAKTTAWMLKFVHARLAPDHSLDAFILRLIDDTPYRRDCVEALSADAGAFTAPYAIIER